MPAKEERKEERVPAKEERVPTKEERKEERVPAKEERKEERMPAKEEYSWQHEKLTFVVNIVFYCKKRRFKSFVYIFYVPVPVITRYSLIANGAMFV